MTFNRYIRGFDKCEPPVCPEDVIITITSVACTSDKKLYVEWNVADRYNRDINSNEILWSYNSQDFNNTANVKNTTDPYKTSFDISSSSGMIYLKAKIRIGTTLIESIIETFDINLCGQENNFAVPIFWCGDCPDSIENPPAYLLYARASTIPSYPVYFGYNELCWHVDSDINIIPIEDLPEGAVLTDISTIYTSCNDCCMRVNNISGWATLPESAQTFPGERVGRFYFEYQI